MIDVIKQIIDVIKQIIEIIIVLSLVLPIYILYSIFRTILESYPFNHYVKII